MLALRIDYLFEMDFISAVDPGSATAFVTILRTFRAYWQFLKACKPISNNISGKPFATKFFTFLYAINAMSRLAEPGILLSGETIINTHTGKMSIAGEDFMEVTMDRCSLEELSLMYCKVHGTSIMNSGVVELLLDEVQGDMHFNQVTIGKLNLGLYSSAEITFDNCIINTVGTIYLKRKNLVEFSECSFSTDAYEVLKDYTTKIKLTNCKVVKERLNSKTFEIKPRFIQLPIPWVESNKS
jgi:hypothetical protein